MIRIVLAAALSIVMAGCLDSSEGEGAKQTPGGQSTTSATRAPQAAADSCAVTRPNGRVPPGERASPGSNYLGNGSLWTVLYPNPVRPRPEDVREDGSIEMKFPWWRGVAGRLRIEGRRLDATAPPLSAWIPNGYGRRGFQSTAITFPTAGCWEVIGRVGGASLTFVSLILMPGDDV
jgi:hypothetical protein